MNIEGFVEDFEQLLGLALAFYPATAPFAGPVLATLPTVTHNVFQATSGKVDAATQTQLISASITQTAKAVDTVSTGGEKKTLDAITQPVQEGGPSLLDLAVSKIVSMYQEATAAPTTNQMLQQSPPA